MCRNLVHIWYFGLQLHTQMKTVTSVSGGQTSAYIAANYPSDYLVFALVRIEDKASMYPDAGVRKIVSDKIGADFIATAEDDIIIRTMLDLEQFLGKEIVWVTGMTYDATIKMKGGVSPEHNDKVLYIMAKAKANV